MFWMFAFFLAMLVIFWETGRRDRELIRWRKRALSAEQELWMLRRLSVGGWTRRREGEEPYT